MKREYIQIIEWKFDEKLVPGGLVHWPIQIMTKANLAEIEERLKQEDNARLLTGKAREDFIDANVYVLPEDKIYKEPKGFGETSAQATEKVSNLQR